MKKKYHIKKSSDIEITMKNKHFFSTKILVVYAYKNPQTTHFRYAVSVGKKIGKAHLRNYIKRVLRNIVLECCLEEEIIDIFIVARKGIEKLSYHEIKLEFIKALEKLKIKTKCEVNV